MASAQRQADPDLIAPELDALRDREDFFRLVHQLERLARTRAGEGADVGRDGPPAEEPLRFHAVSGLAFPHRAVERLWREPGQARLELEVTLLGLTGPTGVLPQHYSTLVQSRLKQRDRALADFLDLFNHRLIALFYRAWAKYRLTVQHEESAAGRDPIGRALQALAGQQRHHDFQPRLYYGGHFARPARSASALQRLLADYLGEPVRVEGFLGQWLPIAPEDRLRIGAERGRNHRLGAGVLLGRRAWDLQSRFRVQIGPISDAVHSQLLPGGERFARLRRLIEEYAPSHLDIELQFLVSDPCRRLLGRRMRLGRNAWLQSTPLPVRRATLQLNRGRHLA